MGFSSKLESIPYIASTMETSPLLNDIEFPTLLTKVTIEAQVFVVQIETDKRTKTVSAWGFATTIYSILFETSNNLNNYELKKRLDSLQQFLTEYVVDMQYLEEIYKANINKK
ncbi:13018_t:CDS:2, partial [Gigaspora margarita]